MFAAKMLSMHKRLARAAKIIEKSTFNYVGFFDLFESMWNSESPGNTNQIKGRIVMYLNGKCTMEIECSFDSHEDNGEIQHVMRSCPPTQDK